MLRKPQGCKGGPRSSKLAQPDSHPCVGTRGISVTRGHRLCCLGAAGESQGQVRLLPHQGREAEGYLGCSEHLRAPGKGEESQQLRRPSRAWTTSPSIWAVPCHSLKWGRGPKGCCWPPTLLCRNSGATGAAKHVATAGKGLALCTPSVQLLPRAPLRALPGGWGQGGVHKERQGAGSWRPRGIPLLSLLLQ